MSQLRRILFALLECTVLLTAPVLFASPEPQEATSARNGDLNVMKVNSDAVNKEIRIGQAMAKEVERSSIIIDDSVTTQYLNHLAQNLVRNSDAPFSITVKIIDSAAKNELILPGGLLYIDDGLILLAETESELVGALAYGVAYSALRCGTEQATLGQFIQVSSIPAMILELNGWAGYGLYEGMNLAIPLTYLREQREFVLAADRLGLKYLYRTGYDPGESVRLLEQISLHSVTPKNEPSALSPFPPLAVRLDSMRKEIANVLPALEQATISSSEFEKAKNRLSARKRIDSQPVPLPALRKPSTPKS